MSKKTGVVYALTVLWISAAVLFTSAAQALEIRQFDKMVKDDQAECAGRKHEPTSIRSSGIGRFTLWRESKAHSHYPRPEAITLYTARDSIPNA
ncbi:MAG: hypothetical protein ABI217_05475 [Chthoniobacterales bacterium]